MITAVLDRQAHIFYLLFSEVKSGSVSTKMAFHVCLFVCLPENYIVYFIFVEIFWALNFTVKLFGRR